MGIRGMLRLLFKIVLGVFVCLAPVAGYAAAPFWTAWSIREAVTGNDTAFLERKIQWPTVRETMRQSMTRTALDLPGPDAAPVDAALAPRRGLWARLKDRVKAYAGRRVVDKMVDAYVSAEGLPRLYQARRTYRQTFRGEASDPADWKERFAKVWARVKRAEFKSMTVFEIEIEDQFKAERSYLALLELKGAEWIMTELRIRSAGQILPLAAK